MHRHATIMALVGPMALAGCMMPASRMPPVSPMMAPAAPPAMTQQPAYAPQPVQTAGAWPAAPGLPVSAEPAPPPATGIAGLQERQPDLCGADRHRSAIGQPGATVPSLGITRSYRVVEYRGIEPQDYVPDRIVFRLDAAGNISNIDCG